MNEVEDKAPREGPWAAASFEGPPIAMSDHNSYNTPFRILASEIDSADPQVVLLHWSDGQEGAVHSLMLRDQ